MTRLLILFLFVTVHAVAQQSVEEIVFTDINEALKVKDRVRHFKVIKDAVPLKIGELTGLETLTLENEMIVRLPNAIGSLTKLRKLVINPARAMSVFPEVQLPSLTHCQSLIATTTSAGYWNLFCTGITAYKRLSF